MKHLTLIFLYLMIPLVMWSQPRFVPDADIIKVGEVMFQRPKIVTFGFINKGDRPLILHEVRPSCGCLAVDYPQEPVAAGERAQIRVIFDAGLLGTFYKDVEILTNASDKPIYLALQGCVVTEVHDFSGDYPIDLGNVRMETNYLEFDNVNKGDHPVAELRLVNTEHTVYHPELMHLPPYLTAEYIPESIPAGQEGIIRLTLNSEELPMLGLNQTSVYLARYMGDKVGDANEILVSAVLLPDFSQLGDEQRDKAPKLIVSEHNVDMGSLGLKQKKTVIVTLRNAGESPLHIHQVQVFNKAISVSLGNRTLKPGKSSKLKITAHAQYLKSAKNRPRVLLISDDPEHAKEVINIEVEE